MGDQILLVEGKDDAVVIGSILSQYKISPEGYENSQKYKRDFNNLGGGYPDIKTEIKAALEKSDYTNIGIVVDANGSKPSDRFSEIVRIIKGTDLINFDPEFETEGTVIELPFVTIGVWIMPDNINTGYLEHLLCSTINQKDPLFQHVKSFIKNLENQPYCKFSSTKTQKAILHTFLSVQSEPGRPMGQAISKGYFDVKHEIILLFVEWFKKTFRCVQS